MTNAKQPASSADAQSPSIEQLLKDLATSGLSTAAFARAKGVRPWKLYNALRARNRGATKKPTPKRPALIPVRLQDQPPKRRPSFELVLAGGHRVLVPEDFDAAALRRLMGALAGC